MKSLIALALTVASLGAASSAEATDVKFYYWTNQQAMTRAPSFDGCMGVLPRLQTAPPRYRNFICVKTNDVLGTLWYFSFPMKTTGPRTYKLGMGSRTTEAFYDKVMLRSRHG